MELSVIIENAFYTLCTLSSWNILIISVVLFYINWRRTPHPKFPPGPKGVPLLGVVPFLSDQPGRNFKQWSLKYGPIMSVRLGTQSVVILNDYNSINQALVKQGNIFSDRPWVELFCSLTKQHGIVFKKYGEGFKAQKHFALKYLREHGLAKNKMETIINDECDIFVMYLRDLQSSDKQVDLKHTFFQATSNVISQVVFGTRSDYGDQSFNKLLHAMSMLFSDPEHAARQSLIFVWNFLAKLPYFKSSMEAFEGNMTHLINEMQEKVDEHKIKYDGKNIKDFIDAFLFEQNNGNRPKEQEFRDSQLLAVCRDFFMAGTETSSTTLSWLFVLYLNFPEHQKKIDEEIDNLLGSSGVPSMSKRTKMPFTCAFIQETMRYRVIAHLAAQHCTITDVKLQGFVIPKGTTVIPNLQGALSDPNDWPNPKKFDPYRHIDASGQFVNLFKMIPFGIGSRFCLGESLARVEIFMFFVKILQKFHVRSTRDYPPPLDKEIVSAVVGPRECVVTLVERN